MILTGSIRVSADIFPSEIEVVDRGFKAVTMIYHLTDRVPSLIEQSHLERNEGTDAPCLAFLRLI